MGKNKYDANTAQQFQNIDRDKRIDDLAVLCLDYEERINTLEDARKVQIKLNEQFIDYITEPLENLQRPKRTLLDIILRR